MREGTVIPLRDYSRPIRERHAGPCGPYLWTVPPILAKAPRDGRGRGGYLSRDGSEFCEGSGMRLRVRRADEIVRLNHTGWYCDEYRDQIIFGMVATLPRSRGFLAGWSMGEGMATSFDADIFDTAEDAARAADSMAEYAAEREREYQEQWQAEQDAADADEQCWEDAAERD